MNAESRMPDDETSTEMSGTVKLNITTLGCPKNVVDSVHLKGSLTSEGFLHVDDLQEADLLLVNTCGFIREAKEESIEEILKLARMTKGQGKNRKRLVVFGCLAQRYRNELLKEIPEIDEIWGVGEDRKIIEYCRSLVDSRQPTVVGQEKTKGARGAGCEARGHKPIPPVPILSPHASSSYAYLKIAEGCDKKCTFCVIPSIRGRFRSLPSDGILKEAEEYVRAGVRELILVAQDITSYGKELRGYNLVSLLRDMASISGDFRIRLLYLYPTAIDDGLLEEIAGEDKIHKYLDIPLQHSEDRILRLMGRRGTRKEYGKLLRQIRRTIPEVALRTTFIVGFPSETEEEFNGLADFIEEMRFDRLGVFKYSREEGTPAAHIRGQIPGKVKDRRLDEIMKRQALVSLEKNRDLVGRRYEAVIDEIDGDLALARLYSHAPEIDGMVIIERSEVRRQEPGGKRPARRSGGRSQESGEALRVGNIVTVEIVDAYDYDMRGVVIDDGIAQDEDAMSHDKSRIMIRK